MRPASRFELSSARDASTGLATRFAPHQIVDQSVRRQQGTELRLRIYGAPNKRHESIELRRQGLPRLVDRRDIDNRLLPVTRAIVVKRFILDVAVHGQVLAYEVDLHQSL